MRLWKNIHVGNNFLTNYNVTILDIAPVNIGDYVMIGPNSLLTTIGHPTEPQKRKEKCNLVLTARREEKLKETISQCERLKGKAIYFVGNVRKEDSAIKTIHLAITTFGRIDILVDNAGIGPYANIRGNYNGKL